MDAFEKYKRLVFTTTDEDVEWNELKDSVKYKPTLPTYLHTAFKTCRFDDNDKRKAFKAMENYALNLIRYPWKDEIKSLRSYSGFYQMNVARVLMDPESLLKELGYRFQKDTFILEDNNKDINDLFQFAFNCFKSSIYVGNLEENQIKVSDLDEVDGTNAISSCNEKLIVDLPPPQEQDTEFIDEYQMKQASCDNISIASDLTRGHDDIPTEPVHKPPPKRPYSNSMESMDAFYQNIDEVDRSLNKHLDQEYSRGHQMSTSASNPHMTCQHQIDAVVHNTQQSDSLSRGESLNCMASFTGTGATVIRSESMDGVPKNWSCSNCTYNNKPENKKCEICQASLFQ